LCFPIGEPEEQAFLVPDALPKNSPDFRGWAAGSLRFRFRYGHLPASLIPRFIVAANRNITDQPTRWRTGIRLRARDCEVLVQGDLADRVIEIAVKGPAGMRRAALNVVLDHLEFVHRRNPGLEPKAFVPLPDQPELEESYEHLVRLEEVMGPDYQHIPSGSGHPYIVRDLLEGVRRDGQSVEEQSAKSLELTKLRTPSSRVIPAPKDSSTPTVVEMLMDWRWFSLSAAIIAAILTAMIFFVGSSWRWAAVSVLFAFVIMFFLVLKMNPSSFYRRCIGLWLFGGTGLFVLSGSLSIFSTQIPWIDKIALESGPDVWIVIIWAIVAIALMIADNMSRRQDR
jgi:hypothetical protein